MSQDRSVYGIRTRCRGRFVISSPINQLPIDLLPIHLSTNELLPVQAIHISLRAGTYIHGAQS